LDKQIAPPRDLNGNALAGIACPNVEARVARTSMDSQEVEVGVEARENGVNLAVSAEITCCRGEKMWSTRINSDGEKPWNAR